MKIHENALKFIFEETLYKSQSSLQAQIESNIHFIGGNNKRTLIITPSNTSSEIIEVETKNFLDKILTSIGLSEKDVIVTKWDSNLKKENYFNDFAPDKVLFFGIKPFEFGITELDINSYEIKHHDSKLLLYCDDLDVIKQDINKKKALWVNLKQLFS